MKTKKLGDLVKITIGRTPSRSNSDYWDKNKESENVWLSIADLLNVDGRTINGSKEYISDEAASNFASVPEGTLLVSFKLTLGRLAFAGRDLRTNEAIAALRNDESEVLNEYLYYFLSYFDWMSYASVDKKVKGFTLNKAKLHEINVYYPESLDEQLRIITKLDAAFDKIDQSVDLTRVNKLNAGALLRSTAYKLLSTAEGEEKTVGDILKLEYGKPLDRADRVTTGKFAAYGANGIKDKTDKYYWDQPSIIVGRKGSAGELTKVSEPFWPLDVTYYVVHDSNETSIDYIYSLLKSLDLPSFARGVKPGINRNDIYSLDIIIPPISDQIKTAKKIDAMSAKTKHLAELYDNKLKLLKNLKQSMLTEVFAESAVK